MKRIKRIAIVGVGLIGGSIGLAIKRRKLAGEVVGIGHRAGSIKQALKMKTVDRGTLDLKSGVEGADIVILATPILSMAGLVRRIAPHLKRGAILTDVGSTKARVTRELEKAIPSGIHFVGGHPMAGSEKRGVAEARGDLFKGSLCIITRTKKTGAGSLKTIKGLWQALGAKVIVLSPRAHDRIVSQISHLPHMLVFSMLAGIDRGSLRFASSGFYDTTRIASSDSRIWRDIAISNRDEITRSIARFKKDLSTVERAIRKEDGPALLRIFKSAKNKRELLR